MLELKRGAVQVIDVSKNQLSGSIPDGWAWTYTSTVQEYNLSYNRLTGTIPNSIMNYDKLATIDLSHNRFVVCSQLADRPVLCSHPLLNTTALLLQVARGVLSAWLG
jgi:hypothetical protein